MKIQDIGFLIILTGVLFLRNAKIAVLIGLAYLVLAIPLFAKWVFFTAERLTWYAAAFFLAAVIIHIRNT